jgi:hypothetical protein
MVDAMAVGMPVDPLARYFEYWLLRLQGVYQPDPRASSAAIALVAKMRACSPFALADMRAPGDVWRELEASHRALI